MAKRKEVTEISEMDIKKSGFVNRLYRETCDISNKYIKFDDDGDKLIIPNKIDFIKKALNKISSTKDYSSFVRQLNNYGFTKIKLDNGDSNCDIYYHQNFHRYHPDLISLITRDKSKNGDYKDNMTTFINSLQYLASCNYKQQKEINDLKDRIKTLETKYATLYEIISNAFRQGIEQYQKHNTMYFNNNSLLKNMFAYNQELDDLKDNTNIYNNAKLVNQLKLDAKNSNQDDNIKKTKNAFDEFYF